MLGEGVQHHHLGGAERCGAGVEEVVTGPVELGRVVDGEVGVQGRRAATHRLDVGDSGGRTDGIRPVVHADVVTGGGQRDGDAAPEPAAGAGDQGRHRI